MNIFAVGSDLPHGAHALHRKGIPHVDCVPTIVWPRIVAVRAQNEVIELLGGICAKERKVEPAHTVLFAKDDAKRFLQRKIKAPKSATLDAKARIRLKACLSTGVN